jgi:hypothetical protein
MSWSCEYCGKGRSEDHNICELTAKFEEQFAEINNKLDNLIKELGERK